MVKVNNPDYQFNETQFYDFCKKYGFIFPKSLIDYLKINNDAELEPNIIHTSNNDYYIRYFYGTTEEDYSNISSVYAWYLERLPEMCIPIADPDFGNQICMALNNDSYGNIYFWDHEIMDTEDGEKCTLKLEDMVLIAHSFEELLIKIVESPY